MAGVVASFEAEAVAETAIEAPSVPAGSAAARQGRPGPPSQRHWLGLLAELRHGWWLGEKQQLQLGSSHQVVAFEYRWDTNGCEA